MLSGVAIATALMPPLCTVGYGISVLNTTYILGALYLFIINSIFIALATYVMVKYLKYPAVEEEEGNKTRLHGRAVAIILLLIIVPSVLSAIRIVRETNFKIHAAKVVEENKTIGRGFIYDYHVDLNTKPVSVVLFMAGEKLAGVEKEQLYRDAERYGISRSQIVFREDAVTNPDKISESEIVMTLLERSDKQIKSLLDSIAVLNSKLDVYRSQEAANALQAPAESEGTAPEQ